MVCEIKSLYEFYSFCIEWPDKIKENFLDLPGFYLDWPPPAYLSLENIKNSDKTDLFLGNLKIPALMVPPEHRTQVAFLVKQLSALVRAVAEPGKT